ncbi:hypothetical protein EBU94_07255 [bacterium]|nr:hypothetical protein [bacterium]
MNFINRFKKFGGEFIPDIVEYLKDYIQTHPRVTISVGCDSVQRRRTTLYAITIMLHNQDLKNGAHVVFFRNNITKVRDNFERLHKEAQFVLDIGDFLQKELEPFYTRQDLNDIERRRYKYHVGKCNGEYDHISHFEEEDFYSKMFLTEHEKSVEFKLVDLHVDFNPKEGLTDKKGIAKNKSFMTYKSYVPWLRGLGYRVWSKPNSVAATSAADLLLQD